jgi:hypothetical protein
MAAPTGKYKTMPNDANCITATDTPGERRGAISGEAEVSTGVGNEADFGSVDITAATDTESAVIMMLWGLSAANSNTTVDNVKLWLTTPIGFDQVDSVVRFRALSGTDETTPTNTVNMLAADPNIFSTFSGVTDLPEAEPGSNNLWDGGPDDTVKTIDITTIGSTDTYFMWMWYLLIDGIETLGTYKGVDAGFEIRFNTKFDYS